MAFLTRSLVRRPVEVERLHVMLKVLQPRRPIVTGQAFRSMLIDVRRHQLVIFRRMARHAVQ